MWKRIGCGAPDRRITPQSALVFQLSIMPRTQPDQLNLFDAPAPAAAEPSPPDADFARKHLGRLLRTVEAAEVLPWSAPQTRTWETLFPQVAQALPEAEREELCDAFATHLARLRAR